MLLFFSETLSLWAEHHCIQNVEEDRQKSNILSRGDGKAKGETKERRAKTEMLNWDLLLPALPEGWKSAGRKSPAPKAEGKGCNE